MCATKNKSSALELILSDEVQSLLDDFAALIDARVTFFGPDGTRLRRGKEMCNSEFCRHIQSCPGGLAKCVAMDAAIQPGEHVLQVLLVYDKNHTKLNAFNPSDLKKELDDVAFKSQLGEFQLNTFEPSDMADREAFFLESVKLVADAKEVKHLVVIPSETEYGDKLPEIFEKVDGKESIHVLGMNPPAPSKHFRWEMLGYAVLQALGIRSDEI